MSHMIQNQQQAKEQLALYVFKIIATVLIFIFSRALLTMIFFVLLVPVLIIGGSLWDTEFAELGSGLIKFFIWPVTITGRTSFDETDIGAVIFGWTIVMTVLSLITAVLPWKLKFRFRHIAVPTMALYGTAILITLLDPRQSDKIGVSLFILGFFALCMICLAIYWMLNRIVSPHIKPTL